MSQSTVHTLPSRGTCPEVIAARNMFGEISSVSEQVERDLKVPAELIQKMNEAGLFNVTVPKVYGGLERSPNDFLSLIEEVSYADSAAGWCTMIYATTALTAASLTPEWGKKIYGDFSPAAITGGATAPTGKAKRVDGGIEVTGRWAWGSGSHHCDWICGGTLFEEDGDILRFENGEPMVHVVYFEKDQVTLLDNWDPSGLRGTGSVDFEVKNAFVPEGRWVLLGAGERHIHEPLFRVPFFGIFASAVASVPVGIARRALDEFTEIARKKIPAWKKSTLNESSIVQLDMGRAEALIESGRRHLHHVMSEIWEKAQKSEKFTTEDRRQMRLAASQATANCVAAVDLLYNAGGGTSIQGTCGLQRHFRDIHAATQHRLVSNQPLQLAGALRLNETAPGMAHL